MVSLMYAKESMILSTLKDIEEDHRRTQEVNLMSSNVWKAKSVAMTANLVCRLARLHPPSHPRTLCKV